MPLIAALERNKVVEGITAALSSTVGIADAAYFGSTAAERVDSLSDIDLVVQCDSETASRFVRRLHEVLEVVLFCPFSKVPPPAGRYWFRAANPFLRLDVSFYDRVDFDPLLAHGIGPKQPPFRPVELGEHRVFVEPVRSLPDWSDSDYAFARALRRFHESAKAVLRGHTPEHPLDNAEDAVRRFGSSGLRREILGTVRTVRLAPRHGFLSSCCSVWVGCGLAGRKAGL